VQSILTDYAVLPCAHVEVRFETVTDCASDRYLLMLVGWEGIRRVHGCLIHVDIINGKIWIQRDGTERGVARDLIDAGVPRDQIVLAFQPDVAREVVGRAPA
jgi:XisI protein